MIKLRLFLLLSSLLFLYTGCVPYLSKSSIFRNQTSSHSSNNHREVKDSNKPHNNSPSEETATGNKHTSATLKSVSQIENPSIFEKRVQDIFDEALDYCQVAQDFWQKGELENAIEALDKAYTLILKINIDDQPKLIQQKEDLRFLISKRILEIYASRNIVVNGNHKAIPIILNKHVQQEIDRFTEGPDRIFFMESYQRSGKYRKMIVSELIKAGLPVELSWLPLIESGYKVNALSKARALGLWQFIPSTGYKFGLMRDIFIDQRLDPVKSTGAAIAYLKELHQIFGDWTTALAAYNCGEGRVLRVIRGQKINYLDNFWDLYEKLPNETARYVPKFLATLHIINNLEKYGFESIIPAQPMEFETIELTRQVHLKHIAKQIGIPESTLAQINSELRYKILPPRTYPLRVPPQTDQSFVSKIEEIPISSPPRRKFSYHRVRRGESLSIIARKYRTRVRTIMRMNRLRRSNYIVAGQILKVPRRNFKKRHRKVKKQVIKNRTIHVVQRGDSLWNIAQRYGTTTDKIRELNKMSTPDLHIGQVLKLPGYREDPTIHAGVKSYQVKPGDSPFTIARQHNMELGRFLRVNQLTARSKIYPGQILLVD